MKSNNDIFVLYKYRNGTSFSMGDTLSETISEHQSILLDDYVRWIEDDSWKTLPRDKFDITFINLDTDGNVSTLEFTERK